MSNQPKNHHYVPKFYLSGFTFAGTDQDKLHVLDKMAQKTWVATPK